MKKMPGCILEPVEISECYSFLAWVIGEGPSPPGVENALWLLAHCDDGVVWGKRYDLKDPWYLSHVPFPDISPKVSKRNLQQLRIFGSTQEVLIWRIEGSFRGRTLTDTEEIENALQPITEEHILVGDRLLADPKEGFSLVGEANGTRHAVPFRCEVADFQAQGRVQWPLRLTVKHYLAKDNETGSLRIAVSRLVHVRNIARG